MIISASRRTDIPAFYATWLINRLRAGYCTVPNPFNRVQVSTVSLKPADVDVIVLWTRNAAPLLSHLEAIDDMGFRYYFQYTLVNYPRELDQNGPALEASLATFRRLSDQIGPDKVIWRYDPIVFTKVTDLDFHIVNYRRIAEALKGYAKRSVISIMDVYQKFQGRMKALEEQGFPVDRSLPGDRIDALMESISKTAAENGMEVFTCAEEKDLSRFGIRSGKCVDDEYIGKTFGLDVSHQKDPGQRKACGCVVSRDIGMYDTCLFGCQYCYATADFEQAKVNHANHDPQSPSLVGWVEREARRNDLQPEMFKDGPEKTL
jgi:hypothetical protein